MDWAQYLCLCRREFRARRSFALASCYLVFSLMLYLLLEKPDRPVRGWINDWIDFLLLLFSVIATIGLLAFVADATLLCIRFVGRLSDSASARWSSLMVREWAEALGFTRAPAPERPANPDTPHGMEPTVVPVHRGEALPENVQKAIGYLLSVKAIAAQTNGVGPLIYYPAVVLVLLFLARNRALDNWDWPAGQVISFTVAGAAVVTCGMAVRVAADRARRLALEGLEETLHQARRETQGNDEDPLTKAVKATIAAVRELDGGAYSSISENPVFRAVLIPLATLAGLIPLLGQLGVNVIW